MSLESERKASGTAIVSSRRATGQQINSERQATGAGMEAERRTIGRQITEDLNRLVMTPTQPKKLAPLEKRGALEAKTGQSVYDPKNAPRPGGGGIASPLTEPDYSKREYWPAGILSSDGLFQSPAIKVLKLTDADGAEVVINLAQPVTPPPVTP